MLCNIPVSYEKGSTLGNDTVELRNIKSTPVQHEVDHSEYTVTIVGLSSRVLRNKAFRQAKQLRLVRKNSVVLTSDGIRFRVPPRTATLSFDEIVDEVIRKIGSAVARSQKAKRPEGRPSKRRKGMGYPSKPLAPQALRL